MNLPATLITAMTLAAMTGCVAEASLLPRTPPPTKNTNLPHGQTAKADAQPEMLVPRFQVPCPSCGMG